MNRLQQIQRNPALSTAVLYGLASAVAVMCALAMLTVTVQALWTHLRARR